MLRGVLFDLDETLLDFDLDTFLRNYFSDLVRLFDELSDAPSSRCSEAVLNATNVMMSNRDDEFTNEQVFNQVIQSTLGIDPSSPEVLARFMKYYENEAPLLKKESKAASGAHESVAKARELGLKVVLATNPTFPLDFTHLRVRWAGFEPEDFDLITSYETSTRTKPYARYYLETIESAGLKPEEVIMVGNDITNDVPVPGLVFPVFCTEKTDDERVTWQGPLTEVPALLDSLMSGSPVQS